MDTSSKSAAPSATPYISNPFGLIKPSWEAFKLNWAALLLLIAIGFACGVLAVVVIFIFASSAPIFGVALVVLGAIAAATYLGWASAKIALAGAGGVKIRLRESFPPSFNVAMKFLGTSLLAALAIAGGFLLLIVPGFIFMAWFASTKYVIIEEGLYGVAALRRSKQLADGRAWEVLAAATLPAVFAPLLIVPVLGVLAYLGLAFVLSFAFAVRYLQLKALKNQPDWQSTPVNNLNYLAVILALIFGGLNNYGNYQKMHQPNSLEKNIQAY